MMKENRQWKDALLKLKLDQFCQKKENTKQMEKIFFIINNNLFKKRFYCYFPNTIFFLLHSMVTQLHTHAHILFSHISCSIISNQTQFPVLPSRISLLIIYLFLKFFFLSYFVSSTFVFGLSPCFRMELRFVVFRIPRWNPLPLFTDAQSNRPHAVSVSSFLPARLLGASLDVSFFFFFIVFFLGPHQRHMEVPRLGVESGLQPPVYAIATAMRDQPASVTDTTALSNAGSLTHGTRPGFEPAWILGRFVSTEPHWELLDRSYFFLINFIGIQLTYDVGLVSGVQQSDSFIHTHMSILFFLHRLLQNIEQISLCYAAGPCQLSVLYIVVFTLDVSSQVFCVHVPVGTY